MWSIDIACALNHIAIGTADSCTDSQHVVEQLPNADGHLHLHTNHSIVSTVTHASSGVPVARTFQKKSDVSESPNTVLRNREITTAATRDAMLSVCLLYTSDAADE